MMQLGLTVRQIPQVEMECVFCHRAMSDHAPNCIQALCAQQVLRCLHYGCLVCGQRQVDLNTDDFYECRSCHTLFSTSPACGEDAATLVQSLLLTDSSAISVLILKRKGQGRILSDLVLQKLVCQRERARRGLCRPHKKR